MAFIYYWWDQLGSNQRPNDYESSALTTELWSQLLSGSILTRTGDLYNVNVAL